MVAGLKPIPLMLTAAGGIAAGAVAMVARELGLIAK